MKRKFQHLALFVCVTLSIGAQTANTTQQLQLQGLLSQNTHGSFTSAKYASDGTLYLLLNEQDGIRLLHSNSTGNTLLAQAHNGSTGDIGLSMALDPTGNVYVTGTTTSAMLTGTSGTPFPNRADTSTNSFLAKYDANLNLVFLTFLGAGRTSASSVAATADGAFVTGLTYSTTFPVTAAGLQQTPAPGSLQNGFVERFSADGTALLYATYLTGANGDMTPTGIVADSSGNAYVAGLTTASGYPTLSALQPEIIGIASGFLTALAPRGDSFIFSTFIAGNGITGLALDTVNATLLLTGNVSLGGFPMATVATPIVATPYQSLLRLPLDGQSVSASILLAPGTTSLVSTAANGSAWISGTLSSPLFANTGAPLSGIGDSFLLHATSTGALDQTFRFGGIPANNATYSTLTTLAAAPAVSPDGGDIAFTGQLTATAPASLSATQRYDLPLTNIPNALLPNTLRDVASICPSGQCTGSGALFALADPTTAAPSLSLSTDNFPNITLRNLGSSTATGLSLIASGFTLVTNCGSTLEPSNQCSLALTGPGPGTLTVSATNATTQTLSLPTNSVAPDALALSTNELDFGVVTSTSPASKTLTVTNLTASSQTFPSALDRPATTAYSFKETASDCGSGGTTGTHVLAANASCHITLSLTASSASTNDGPAQQYWLLGTRDILLTGFAQATALNVSASELNFGTQFSGNTSLYLPRYLYLSNNSSTSTPHAAVALPASSPFSIVDECPSMLEPHSVCRITANYLSPSSPAEDTATLSLDDGLTVLLTGKTLPSQGVTGSAANPNLSVSPATITFPTSVLVTQVSGTPQAVTITNTGSAPLSLNIALGGDFIFTNGCPETLSANASCQVLTTFTPSQPGPREGVMAVTGGSGFAPAYVALSGTAAPLLPANNGVLALGQTFVGEPAVAWYKVQTSVPQLTVFTNSPIFGVALVPDTGNGHGTLPATSFTSTVTASCANCWLGVQFLSGTTGTQTATLELASIATGKSYDLTLMGTALPVQGLLLTPAVQDFGPIAVHSSSAPLTFTLTNLLTTSTAVTIQSASVTGDFTVITNTTGGPSCNGQLPSTASCFLNISFAPTATGTRTGTLTVVTSGGAITASLTGYGEADPGIAFNPTSLTFSNALGATATQQPIVLTNTSNTMLIVGTPSASDPSFTVSSNCTALAPAATCTLTTTFQPQNATVAATLTIPITATENGQTSTTTYAIPLAGTYTATTTGLTILPNLANFGSLATESFGLTQQFTLNNFTPKPMSIALTLPRQFALASPNACSSLVANSSCVFSVSFLPVTSGENTATVTATGTPVDGSATVQALGYMIGYGNGNGNLTINPVSPLNFGQLTSGQTTSQTVTLTNSGPTDLIVRRITSQPPFYSTTTCGATLIPNATCAITLTYTPIDEVLSGSPTDSRNDLGQLTIESDAATSPTVVTLSGIVLPVVSSSPASSTVLSSFDLSESAVTFANTTVGSTSPAQTVQLTNTGATTLHIASILAPTDYVASTTCATLLAGQRCTLTIVFAPTTASTSSIRTGTLRILSDAATSLEFLTLFATSSPAPLTLSSTTLDFGTLPVDSSDNLNVTITNNSAAAITFTAITATGDYTTARNTCPANGATLAASSSCSLTVTFTPTAAGTRTGALSLSTDATPQPLTVALTGIGTTATLQITPGALAFGTIAIGAPANLSLNVLNTGTATVTGIAANLTGSNAADFAVTSPCSDTQLAPNQGCNVTVTFTPSTTNPEFSTLSFVSSDPSSPTLIPLTGTGIAAGIFTFTVNGSNSATVTVPPGAPATYSLLLMPQNGFNSQIALTCTPINPAQYATCSLLASTFTLNGSAQSSTATINTLTSQASLRRSGFGEIIILALLLFPWRRRPSKKGVWMIATAFLVLLFVMVGILGCGSSHPSQSGNPKLLYAPAGSYQYQVTASTTSGPQVSRTVILNLIIQ